MSRCAAGACVNAGLHTVDRALGSDMPCHLNVWEGAKLHEKATVGDLMEGAPGKSMVGSLLSISKITRAMVALKLSEIDVHVGQDELMLSLSEDTGVSVSHLAERTSVRPSTISKTIDRLSERGLLCRIAHDRDARRSMVKITPLGLEIQAQIRQIRDNLEADLTNKVPANQLADMARALDRTEHLLRQRLARVRTP